MKRNQNKDAEIKKHKWRRTGKTTQEMSFNKGGVIQLAEEVNEKGKTRLVQTGYTTIIKTPKGDN